MDPISAWATAAGLSWASGIRLHAVLFISGATHALGWIVLPQPLQVLADPLVLLVSGSLVVLEFLADKVPLFDTEDALVPATLLITFKYPMLLIGLLAVFVVIVLWLAPKLFRALYSFIIRFGRLPGSRRLG